VYPVRGGMEDWAYAGSWMRNAGSAPCKPTSFGGYPAERTEYTDDQLRIINVLVETSDNKSPPATMFGDSRGLLKPDGEGNGHVSRNVRLALAMADLVQPYVQWTLAGAAEPSSKEVGEGSKATQLRPVVRMFKDNSCESPIDVEGAVTTSYTFPGEMDGRDALTFNASTEANSVMLSWDVGGATAVDGTQIIVGYWNETKHTHAAGFGWEAHKLREVYGAVPNVHQDRAPTTESVLTDTTMLSGPTRWSGGSVQAPDDQGVMEAHELTLDTADGMDDREKWPFQPRWSACVVLPDAVADSNDDFFVMARARVDSEWATVLNGEPNPRDMKPQSHWVNARTNEAWNRTKNGHIVQGQLDWYSVPLRIVRGRVVAAAGEDKEEGDGFDHEEEGDGFDQGGNDGDGDDSTPTTGDEGDDGFVSGGDDGGDDGFQASEDGDGDSGSDSGEGGDDTTPTSNGDGDGDDDDDDDDDGTTPPTDGGDGDDGYSAGDGDDDVTPTSDGDDGDDDGDSAGDGSGDDTTPTDGGDGDDGYSAGEEGDSGSESGEGGDDATPTNEGDGDDGDGDDDDSTPTGDGDDGGEGGDDTTPTDEGGDDTSPTDGGDGDDGYSAGDGGDDDATPTGEGGDDTTPTDGGDDATPTDGGDGDDGYSAGDDDSTPTGEGGDDTTPTSDGDAGDSTGEDADGDKSSDTDGGDDADDGDDMSKSSEVEQAQVSGSDNDEQVLHPVKPTNQLSLGVYAFVCIGLLLVGAWKTRSWRAKNDNLYTRVKTKNDDMLPY
jgi:hypothetical protein